jgi:hypothetical protein
MGSNGYMVDGIQRIYHGGWDPSGESDNSNKSEQVEQCMDLKHCLHWLHAVAPTHLVLRSHFPVEDAVRAIVPVHTQRAATVLGSNGYMMVVGIHV